MKLIILIAANVVPSNAESKDSTKDTSKDTSKSTPKKEVKLAPNELGSLIKTIEYLQSQKGCDPTEFDVKISICFANPDLQSKSMPLLNMMNHKNFQLHVHERSFMTTFEHYNWLIGDIKLNDTQDPSRVWLLFSKIADLWNEYRIAVYENIINKIDPADYDITTNVIHKENSKVNQPDMISEISVKYTFAKKIFDKLSLTQLQSQFCDQFFSRVCGAYGSKEFPVSTNLDNKESKDGSNEPIILKRTVALSDKVLLKESPELIMVKKQSDDPEVNTSNNLLIGLEEFMSKVNTQTVKTWIEYCQQMLKNKNKDSVMTEDTKKRLITLFMDNHKDHIFNSDFIKSIDS